MDSIVEIDALTKKILESRVKIEGRAYDELLKELIEQRQAEEAEIRGEKVKVVPLPAATQSQAVDLPVWGDDKRGVPNVVLRTALFTATARGKRPFLERVEIASVGGISVLFTGPRLDQADADVWQNCLHLARVATGSRIEFTASSFLRDIGRKTDGRTYEWLKASLTRLQVSAITSSDGKRTFSGQLLQNWFLDEEAEKYVIELNPKIFPLFSGDGWTAIDWEQRKQLMGKPLALWLHGFYSSHTNPFDYRSETIWKLCGSETKELKHFKSKLKEAIIELGDVTKWNIKIEDDKLVIIKTK